MSKRNSGRPAHSDILTPAEWAVAEAVRHGLSNPEIAERRGTSHDAVKFHVSNVLTKLGMASRSELRQWTGVQRGSALVKRGPAMANELKFGPIGQVSRMVSALEPAVSFYRDTLGLPHLFSTGEMAFFDCGGVRLYLQQAPDLKASAPESILYFQVADIHASHEALAAKGVTFLSAPHMVHRHENGTEDWMAFFEDPDARPLGLMTIASCD